MILASFSRHNRTPLTKMKQRSKKVRRVGSTKAISTRGHFVQYQAILMMHKL